MELYLDSANIEEIKEASKLGYIAGLTTTPTFMHRDGVTDVDAIMLELAKLVPVLQVEALGNNADEIVAEAHRLVALGLDKDKTVFKIPVSLEGTKACRRLVDEGLMVNLHLVYTLQQAYMAMSAGATYVCPLVGRLQDQGHDALGLVAQCVETVQKYNYNSKIMFSSVRYPEHIKNALNIGVHTCTIPWKVMKQLTENHMTAIGTQQFEEHTRLMTVKVGEVMTKENFSVAANSSVMEALVNMTKSKLGAVVAQNGSSFGVFTDGDLRRLLNSKGEGALQESLSSLISGTPVSIEASATLLEASDLLKSKGIDNVVVTEGGQPVGILDIQDVL